jgi:hypothetical protein
MKKTVNGDLQDVGDEKKTISYRMFNALSQL